MWPGLPLQAWLLATTVPTFTDVDCITYGPQPTLPRGVMSCHVIPQYCMFVVTRLCTCRSKTKSKQKKKRGKKKMGMTPAASMDSKVSQVLRAGLSLHHSLGVSASAQACVTSSESARVSSSSSPLQPRFGGAASTAAADHASAQLAQHSDCVFSHSQQSVPSRPAGSSVALQNKAQQVEVIMGKGRDVAHWRSSNGHLGSPSCPKDSCEEAFAAGDNQITDAADTALLVNMQGFASALGCDWEVRLTCICNFNMAVLPCMAVTLLSSVLCHSPEYSIITSRCVLLPVVIQSGLGISSMRLLHTQHRRS